MTTPLILEGRSCPTLAAAKRFGIPTEFAFLLGDMVLASVWPQRSAWPQGHHWHTWAVAGSDRFAGKVRTGRFYTAMFEFYDAKFHGPRSDR